MNIDDWKRWEEKARRGGSGQASLLPSVYETATVPTDFDPPEPAPASLPWPSEQSLTVLRYVALQAQWCGEGNENRVEKIRQASYGWLKFLIGEDSPGSFYLPHYRAEDRIFYQGRSDLRPKLRAQWGLDSKVEGEWGSKQLEWLRNPERLTIAELEIALVLFQWDQTDPRLVSWARAGAYPHILWRVHAFLLRCYCFELLEPLREAMAEAGVDMAPFRAGELWHWYPRVGGLAAVGLIALISIDAIRNAAFEAPVCVVLLTSLAGLGVLLGVLRIDVFKQNRGLMTDYDHARRRCEKAAAIAVLWGLALAAGYCVLAKFAGAMRPELSGPTSIGRSLLAMLAFGIGSALLGSLLQWFWEDRAMTEPI